MRAITCPVILTSVSTKVDSSLAIRLSTPELSSAEKVAFLDLQGQQLQMLLQPDSAGEVELHEVKSKFDCKTPGQRLRAVLFVLYKQSGEQGEFEEFYRSQMNALIDQIKDKLAPV